MQATVLRANATDRFSHLNDVLIPTEASGLVAGDTRKFIKAQAGGLKPVEVSIKQTGQNANRVWSVIVRRADADQEELYHEDPNKGVLVKGRPRRDLCAGAEAFEQERKFISIRLEDSGGTVTDMTILAKKWWIDEAGVQCALAYHPIYDTDITFAQDPLTLRWTAKVWFALPVNAVWADLQRKTQPDSSTEPDFFD